MALIKCTECGKEISDSAENCPNCGFKTGHGQTVAQAKSMLVQYGFAIGFLVLGIILLCVGSSTINEYRSSYWGEYLWKEGHWTEDSDIVIAVIEVICGIGMMIGFIIDIFILYKKAHELPSAPIKTIATMQYTPRQNNSSDNYTAQNVPMNGWTCTCGRVHPPYVSSCSCGKNKHDVR